MGRLTLRALTPVPQLVDSSGKQLLGPSKQLALLVFLASQPHRRATREQILAYLADRESTDARASLRQILYQLRQVSDTLVIGAEELTLHSGEFEYDVDIFRGHVAAGRLGQAADLYRADFLGTWLPRNALEMEEWIERQRATLLAEWRSVIRRQIDLHAGEEALDKALQLAEVLAVRFESDPEIQALVARLRSEHAAKSAQPKPREEHRAQSIVARVAGPIVVLGVIAVAAFAARGAIADRTTQAGFVIVGWGGSEHPSDTSVFSATESGKLTRSNIVLEVLRTRSRINPSRTIRAYSCPVGSSDSVTICFVPSWGGVSKLPGLLDAQMLAWIGDTAVLVRIGRRIGNRFETQIVRVRSPNALMDTLQALGRGVAGAWPDPSGRFLVVSRHTAEGDEAILYDIEREVTRPLAKCVLVGGDWSAVTDFAIACGQDLFLGRPDTPIVRRVPIKGRVVIGPVFLPNDRSIALVVEERDVQLLSLSLQGRAEQALALPRRYPTLLEVLQAADTSLPQLLIDEEFDSETLDTARWRSFGMPSPRLIPKRGIRFGALFHSGDDRYESGIALRKRVPLTDGLTVEWWAQIPITAPLWQSVNISLCTAPPDSFHLRAGPPVSDAINKVILWAELPNPHGPPDRQMSVNLSGDARSVTESLPVALRDGRWHSYRLSLLPDGHAWLSADGYVIAGPARVDLRHSEATLVIQGRSVGTTVLVDQVRVWKGARPPFATATTAWR